MGESCKISRLKNHGGVMLLMLIFVTLHQNLSSCWCLNEEGLALLRLRNRIESDPFGALRGWHESDGEIDPCSWFGVECSNGKVVLNEEFNQNQYLIHRKMLATHSPPDPLRRDKPVDNGPVATGQPSASPTPSPSPLPSPIPSPPASSTPSLALSKQSKGWSKTVVIGVSVGGFALLLLIIVMMYLYRRDQVSIVKPWATGLSGQLQKAFVAGVPKLKRSELDLSCEDFSNVVGTSSLGTVYKGTLSSGVEIAVVSVAAKCAGDWSNNLEAKFRKKIDMLSKVNHKNFVNLIGYCQEQAPFTRMIVFEYAPNGTLFEHLHIKEAEHLDWGMRVRITMGMAYCIEHLHQLNPPLPHQNLTSSAVALTEDYAAKICDFSFWNQIAASEIESFGVHLVENSSAGPERDVYAFGVILFEMVTGRIPYSVDNEDWAMDYVRVARPLVEMVDPTLSSFDANQVQKIGEIIRSCTHPDPKHRPSMGEVSSRLRSITGIQPDGAIPKISPLWWAELEILSTEGS